MRPSLFREIRRKFSHVRIAEEVKWALEKQSPIVALESTIITHGMPHPDNVKCALQVEDAVRAQGATPATVAVIGGEVKVGLTREEICQLGDVKVGRAVKTSRRDFAFVVGNGLNGGTTVSGTLLVADRVGIPVFATGGVGGVHRGGEATMDVSADLTELGRTGVAVVSSGIKSILDIGRTLEYLETQGVFVATLGAGTRDFPAFYSRKSGHLAPYAVGTAAEAAQIIFSNRRLRLQSGMLFAVPVPEEFALDEQAMNDVIEEALGAARGRGVAGKEITPFLLSRIAEITAGKSLLANVALINNNAKTAAEIAIQLSRLENQENLDRGKGKSCNPDKGPCRAKPVVIGGSNLDWSVKLASPEIKLDGRIHFGKYAMSAGGVARNICEALAKLDHPPDFISVLGGDTQGQILRDLIPRQCCQLVQTLQGHSTGQCTVVFDPAGECKLLLGDMDIHRQITPEVIGEHEDLIKKAPLIVFDGNLTVPTIASILRLAERNNIPAIFEPTDLEICTKPFETDHWGAIKLITPNLYELKAIARSLKVTLEDHPSKVEEAVTVSRKLADFVANIIVTLGPHGVVVARKGRASDSLLFNEGNIEVRHYPTPKVKNLVNVSGAGDCFASGVIAGTLSGLSEEGSVSVGFAVARTALYSVGPVAEEIFGKGHEAWRLRAEYVTKH